MSGYGSGNKNKIVMAACVYAAARETKCGVALIKIATLCQCSVYAVGDVYKRLTRTLQLEYHAADPLLYVIPQWNYLLRNMTGQLWTVEELRRVERQVLEDGCMILMLVHNSQIHVGKLPFLIASAALTIVLHRRYQKKQGKFYLFNVSKCNAYARGFKCSMQLREHVKALSEVLVAYAASVGLGEDKTKRVWHVLDYILPLAKARMKEEAQRMEWSAEQVATLAVRAHLHRNDASLPVGLPSHTPPNSIEFDYTLPLVKKHQGWRQKRAFCLERAVQGQLDDLPEPDRRHAVALHVLLQSGVPFQELCTSQASVFDLEERVRSVTRPPWEMDDDLLPD
jgi:hypothetical protein